MVPMLTISLRFSSGSDRKSTRLNSSHSQISYAVFCLKKNKRYNIYQARILFLRSEDCLGADTAVSTTSVWTVLACAALPLFVPSSKPTEPHFDRFSLQ